MFIVYTTELSNDVWNWGLFKDVLSQKQETWRDS
jgi:hypothetical protein